MYHTSLLGLYPLAVQSSARIYYTRRMATREAIEALFGPLVESNLDMVHAVLARAPQVAHVSLVPHCLPLNMHIHVRERA